MQKSDLREPALNNLFHEDKHDRIVSKTNSTSSKEKATYIRIFNRPATDGAVSGKFFQECHGYLHNDLVRN